jgi:hypothetical protein
VKRQREGKEQYEEKREIVGKGRELEGKRKSQEYRMWFKVYGLRKKRGEGEKEGKHTWFKGKEREGKRKLMGKEDGGRRGKHRGIAERRGEGSENGNRR